MKLYHVEVANIDLSNHHDYILAKDFDDAYCKALKLLVRYKETCSENAELVTVEFTNEITDVEEA